MINENISELKITNTYVAAEIVQLQMASYAVEAEIIGTNSIPTLFDTVETVTKSDETFYGYKINREIVGIISYKFEYGILDIHRLAVHPNHFKKGIACHLLKEVIMKYKDARKVIVATGSKNFPAINLYEKAGFKIIREFEVEKGVNITQLELEVFIDLSCAHKKMRSEKQMMDLITDFAQISSDVRVVLMNGSRVNPVVEKDRFCDYDIVYGVEDPSKYIKDQSWISSFGKTLIIQQNNIESEFGTYYIFLMLFDDGNRIDLQFYPLDHLNKREYDSLEKIVLDKDKRLKAIESPSDVVYQTEKPTDKDLCECINNILWCSTNVVKGLCRKEFNYAKRMQEQIVRADLNTLMRWYIAYNKDWKINTGVFGKWMEEYLTKEEWSMYKSTCAGPEYEDMWKATFNIIHFTNLIGKKLAIGLNFAYPTDDEAGVLKYVEHHYKDSNNNN